VVVCFTDIGGIVDNVCFTDIGGIVDNHVLYFLFTITNNNDSSDNEAHKMSVVSVHNLLTLHMVDPCP